MTAVDPAMESTASDRSGRPRTGGERADGAGVVIFLGPTLSVTAARAVLPAATYLPPVAQGDLLAAVRSPGRRLPWAVGIVDGVFYQSLPVWHKEILYALEQGILVFGAASMGALRAVECAPFGMVGVGEVYRRFAEGELTDDDEVALAHDGPEDNWRGRSLPLVNVRATCEAAVTSGRLSQSTAATVVSAAKALWFPERTRPAILAAVAVDLAPDELVAAEEVFESAGVDVKRADALELLETIRTVGTTTDHTDGHGSDAAVVAPVALTPSLMYLALAERDRQLERGGVRFRAEEIARHVALSHPGYPALRDRALDRLLVEELAKELRVEVDPEEVAEERRRFRVRCRLADDAALAAWQLANDLLEEDFDGLMTSEARARKLRNWAAMLRLKRLMVEPLLNELRLSGEYEHWVEETAALVRRLSFGEDGSHPEDKDASPGQVILDQLQAGGWRPDVSVDAFAEEAGFQGLGDLVEELGRRYSVRQRQRRARDVALSLFAEGDGPTSPGPSADRGE